MMKKIYFRFNWMSLLFLAPVAVLWFLFFISKNTIVYPLDRPTPIPLKIVITYSIPFLFGTVLTSLKVRGLYWWERAQIFLIFKKFEFYKKIVYWRRRLQIFLISKKLEFYKKS